MNELRVCKKHGETSFLGIGKGKNARVRCKKCNVERVSDRRRKVKCILVEEAGGKCIICGYNKCVAALHFHHKDPSGKDFNLALKGETRSIDSMREEASKCILVCANCHSEIHAGVTNIPG